MYCNSNNVMPGLADQVSPGIYILFDRLLFPSVVLTAPHDLLLRRIGQGVFWTLKRPFGAVR